MRRKYRISGLTSQATRELTYDVFSDKSLNYLFSVLDAIACGYTFSLFVEALICQYSNRFPVDERGTMKSVVQYFQETYGFSIQHATLPCLQVGNQQRPNYLPMEVWLFVYHFFLMMPLEYKTFYCPRTCAAWRVTWFKHLEKYLHLDLLKGFQVCKIVEGQRYSKRLNEKQITALLKVTCQRPQERERDIMKVISGFNDQTLFKLYIYL